MTWRREPEGEDPPRLPLDPAAVEAFRACIESDGVGIFPSDTVYGLAADPDSDWGVRRLYALKRRPPMPSATMFFSLDAALAGVPELGPRTRAAFESLLPGPLTLIVANPARRFPRACGDGDPGRLGVRVPALDGRLASLARVGRPVLQTSANLHGGADPRRLDDVPVEIRGAVDVVLDGGELPGISSTVVDLSAYDSSGHFEVLREGAVAVAEVERRLAGIGSKH
jgi:L-threonylcarbamoyladenylate synthase